MYIIGLKLVQNIKFNKNVQIYILFNYNIQLKFDYKYLSVYFHLNIMNN